MIIHIIKVYLGPPNARLISQYHKIPNFCCFISSFPFCFQEKNQGACFYMLCHNLRYDSSSFCMCWICWKCNILSLGPPRVPACFDEASDGPFLYMSAVLPRLCLWCWWVSCMGNTAKLGSRIRD